MKRNVSHALFTLLLFSLLTLVLTCATETRSGNAAHVKTQVCMVVDGSASINGTEWSLIRQALAKAVNDTIPHDGSIELTIVQFGYSSPTYAKTELSPTIIGSGNYVTVASQVLAMPKGGGSTPTAHGLYLGWKELNNSQNSATATKQVINLATDQEPNVRNNNATSDLDQSGGSPTAKDDAIAVVNNAINQGLDELDVEGISLSNSSINWFKEWVVRPQPGIVSPPFTKQGWIRIVESPAAFANTISEKLQVITSGETIWVPSVEGAFFAGMLTVGITSVVSTLSSAVSNPESYPSQAIAYKIGGLFPETLKKWLAEFISAKRKTIIEHRKGSPFALTRREIISYAIALSVLTLAFSYAKAETLGGLLLLIPTVLATSVIMEFVKNFAMEATARSKHVWTEYRLWYFGLATFLISTLAFKVPFSSPSRLIHHHPKFTKRSLGLVAAASVVVPLAFATVFYALFIKGYIAIGNVGVVMCLTMAFFDSIPIRPMNGKDIYDWSKIVWVTLFIASFTLYALCLFLL